MSAVSFTIPWAALESANARLRPGGRRLVNRTAYKRSLEAIHLLALGAVRGKTFSAEDAEWGVTFRFWVPDRRRRDVHNFHKPILDALEGAVYEDDYAVAALHSFREGVDRENPRCEVRAFVI